MFDSELFAGGVLGGGESEPGDGGVSEPGDGGVSEPGDGGGGGGESGGCRISSCVVLGGGESEPGDGGVSEPGDCGGGGGESGGSLSPPLSSLTPPYDIGRGHRTRHMVLVLY